MSYPIAVKYGCPDRIGERLFRRRNDPALAGRGRKPIGPCQDRVFSPPLAGLAGSISDSVELAVKQAKAEVTKAAGDAARAEVGRQIRSAAITMGGVAVLVAGAIYLSRRR